jgi:2-polyprenyl-3-methyl-5-hydroxy-6-metoxy-1,4-benzoquinol methylase
MGDIQLDEFKTRQRAVWATGEYEALSPYITDVGELVVARAAVEPRMAVLDVACGTGNAARPAARAGARVTGIDLVPKFLELGRAKAEAEGLAIEWREGDAENLPFDDRRFDRVLSTFGHMFAPRHQRTADEMARVCRRGTTRTGSNGIRSTGSRTSSWRAFRSWSRLRPCWVNGSESFAHALSMSGGRPTS